jgi:hypothetical protein
MELHYLRRLVIAIKNLLLILQQIFYLEKLDIKSILMKAGSLSKPGSFGKEPLLFVNPPSTILRQVQYRLTASF